MHRAQCMSLSNVEEIPVQNNSATLKRTNVAQNHRVNRFKANLQFHGKQHQMFEHLGDQNLY